MFTMLIILLLTFVVLQIKTSGLPSEDNPEDQNSMKTGLWIGIAVFALTAIYLACYLTFYKSSPLALTLVTQFLFHCIVKVGFLGYSIYKTPNLYNYVNDSFRINFFHPDNLMTNAVTQPLAVNQNDGIA